MIFGHQPRTSQGFEPRLHAPVPVASCSDCGLCPSVAPGLAGVRVCPELLRRSQQEARLCLPTVRGHAGRGPLAVLSRRFGRTRTLGVRPCRPGTQRPAHARGPGPLSRHRRRGAVASVESPRSDSAAVSHWFYLFPGFLVCPRHYTDGVRFGWAVPACWAHHGSQDASVGGPTPLSGGQDLAVGPCRLGHLPPGPGATLWQHRPCPPRPFTAHRVATTRVWEPGLSPQPHPSKGPGGDVL